MKIKTSTLLLTVAVGIAAIAGSFGAYKYFNRDLTGYSPSEIRQFQADHPKVKVTYTVTVEGGEVPIFLDGDTTLAELTTPAQAEDLASKKGYFPNMEVIDLGSTHITSQQIDLLQEAFPTASLIYNYINVLGEAVPADTEVLDWSSLTLSDLDRAIADIKHLPKLRTIELRGADGMPYLSLDDALRIHEAYPHLHIGYAVKLFGQTIDTDMEAVEYLRVSIGDEGLEEIRALLPLMDKLTYLKLDACGTSDDAMAQLRSDFPNMEIHWRVYAGSYNVMTDNYKFWAGGLTDPQTKSLIHLRSTKYLDVGHHNLTNLDFCANLKDLEVGIFAIGPLTDISGLQNCTKLEYLELMCNGRLEDEDLEILSAMVDMEHLNIGDMPKLRSLAFTDNMTKLKRFHCTMNNIPQEEIDRFMALHPDCDVNFSKGTDPILGGWRYNLGGQGIHDARYLLLREQIGYLGMDESKWPKGELKEAITYESTGITPEQ